MAGGSEALSVAPPKAIVQQRRATLSCQSSPNQDRRQWHLSPDVEYMHATPPHVPWLTSCLLWSSLLPLHPPPPPFSPPSALLPFISGSFADTEVFFWGSARPPPHGTARLQDSGTLPVPLGTDPSLCPATQPPAGWMGSYLVTAPTMFGTVTLSNLLPWSVYHATQLFLNSIYFPYWINEFEYLHMPESHLGFSFHKTPVKVYLIFLLDFSVLFILIIKIFMYVIHVNYVACVLLYLLLFFLSMVFFII